MANLFRCGSNQNSNLGNMKKLDIVNISSSQTTSNSPSLWYDGISTSSWDTDKIAYVANTGTISVSITMKSKIKLFAIKVKHLHAYGTSSPTRAIINGVTYEGIEHNDAWNIIPIIPAETSEEIGVELPQQFEISLYSGGQHTGTSEIELYGY